MASITLTCPDANVPELVASLADKFGPQQGTPAQFIKGCIIGSIRELVIQHRRRVAQETADGTPDIPFS